VIQPTSVIVDLNDDVPALVVGTQPQLTGARFAVRLADVRGFDPVID